MLQFKRIRWKNFLSTGNIFTEIDITKNSTTLIHGQNGSGKSTFLDAICFSLYGKPFRKIKKDQLVNSINTKDCLVEIEFDTNGKSYKIIRGIRPNVFEIYQDGSLIDQSASLRDYQDVLEKNILRMNMKSFTQIVILGSSSFVPFMQLSTGQRREVLEDLLDIKIFTRMASLLKSKFQELKDSILIADRDLISIAEQIKIHENMRTQASDSRDRMIRSYEDKIGESEKAIGETKAQIREHEQQKRDIEEMILDENELHNKIFELENYRKTFRKNIKTAEERIEFFQSTCLCPTCDQNIDEYTRDVNIEKKKLAITKFQEGIERAQKQIDKLSEAQRENRRMIFLASKETLTMNRLRSEISSHEMTIRKFQERIRELREEPSVIDEEAVLALNTRYEDTKKKRDEMISEREIHDMASIILRDTGIKSRVVKQYIPVINTLINKYLAAMNFFVKFELNENFEEKILSRHRDEFTYDSFSEGEKLRIDLALLFTWRTIARMKNSANTNLLILDEVFDASLDAAGCDEFLELIDSAENANIFCISHKGEVLHDKFRGSIRFVKQGNFSRIDV